MLRKRRRKTAIGSVPGISPIHDAIGRRLSGFCDTLTALDKKQNALQALQTEQHQRDSDRQAIQHILNQMKAQLGMFSPIDIVAYGRGWPYRVGDCLGLRPISAHNDSGSLDPVYSGNSHVLSESAGDRLCRDLHRPYE